MYALVLRRVVYGMYAHPDLGILNLTRKMRLTVLVWLDITAGNARHGKKLFWAPVLLC
jgi:hypothetical protein